MAPRKLVFYTVRSRIEGFDWGLGAMRMWRLGPLMLCHYDWSLNDNKGNRWAVLLFTNRDALFEFYEGLGK